MSAEPDRRRRQISDLYHAALSQSPVERAAFLEQACSGDTALRQEVESLLQYEPAASRFLEAPAAVMAGVSDVPGTSMVGRELGPYRLLAPLGAGGMGEVYRARDSKLGRDVAIKVLPAFFSADPERRARFAREARLLATLNHPHIGAIYGLEETAGATALVLELIEGPTLADRLERGSLALSEALAIARQVAEALEAAHEHGIIHRDLKPANIVLQGQRDDVRVKVLDFGLAKFVESHEDQAATAPEMARTEDGRILGTPAYMSPEQARGEAVDRRTDIWAFGCVLFEMLSGRRAFEGQTIPDTLAHLLERDPDWSALPARTPTALRSLLERCLRKEPRKRLHDIADARIELEERMLPADSSASSLAGPLARNGRKRLAWSGVAILAMAAVAASTLPYLRNAPGAGPELVVFPIAPAENSRFIGTSPEFAISPNGRQVAFVAASNRGSMLWVRSIDAVEIRPLDGTDGARNPFWSPDSQSVGYFAGGKLKIIRVNGGSPVDLSPVGGTAGAVAPSGTWSSGDEIVYGPIDGTLHRIDAKGGAPTPVSKAKPQDTAHRWPSFLADGRRFLYLALKGQKGELRVGSLNSTESVTLGPFESHASYAMGHLFFVRGGNLMAQPFDAGSTELTGSPQFLGSQAGVDPPWQRGMFSVSETGRLVYRPVARMRSQLTWLDRHGRPVSTLGDPGVFFNLDLSPDGQRVAVSQLTQRPGTDAQFDIWLIDVSTGRTRRLTGDQGWDFDPAWSPQGTHIAFNSNQPNPGTGPFGLFMRPADGGDKDVRLVEGEAGTEVVSPDWSLRDEIIYTKHDDLWRLALTGNRTPIAFMKTPHAEGAAVVSPNGGWIAFQSDETGRMEVYVRPFPGPDPVRPISRDGGRMPRWRRDGSELYFLSLDQTLMVAAIDTRPAFTAGVPQPLFGTALGLDNYRPYAVSPDGQRFLLPVFVPADARDPLRLVMDWRAMLGR